MPPYQNAAPPKKSFPVWGIVVIVLGVLMFGCLILAAILFPVFKQAKNAARQSAGMVNAQRIAMAGVMYTTDYDGLFPPQFETHEQMRFYFDNYMDSPDAYDTFNPAVSFMLPNTNLAGVNIYEIYDPSYTVMIEESTPWENARLIVGFVDGSSRIVDTTSEPIGLDVYLLDEIDDSEVIIE